MGFLKAIDAEKTGRRALRMGNTHTTPNFFGETLNTTRNRMKRLIVQNDRYFLGVGKPRLYCDHWERLWLQWHVRRLWVFRIAFSFDCSSNGGCQLQCWRIGSGGNMMMWQWQPRQMYNLWHAMHLAVVEKVAGLHGDSDAHEDRFILERTVLLTDSDITKLKSPDTLHWSPICKRWTLVSCAKLSWQPRWLHGSADGKISSVFFWLKPPFIVSKCRF